MPTKGWLNCCLSSTSLQPHPLTSLDVLTCALAFTSPFQIHSLNNNSKLTNTILKTKKKTENKNNASTTTPTALHPNPPPSLPPPSRPALLNHSKRNQQHLPQPPHPTNPNPRNHTKTITTTTTAKEHLAKPSRSTSHSASDWQRRHAQHGQQLQRPQWRERGAERAGGSANERFASRRGWVGESG